MQKKETSSVENKKVREEISEDLVDQVSGGYFWEGDYNNSQYKKADIVAETHLFKPNKYILHDGTVTNASGADTVLKSCMQNEAAELAQSTLSSAAKVTAK